MRIVFMGSPAFAVPAFRMLAADYTIIGVVTQADKAAGRGRKLGYSPIKQAALDLSLPILQPTRVRDEEPVNVIKSWSPDLIIVAAYGQILSQDILDIPRMGSINIHASLLPCWRGAAPIQAAILQGDEETGITLMLMDIGLDTGPVLTQSIIKIEETETAGELSLRLSHLGAEHLRDTLPDYIQGKITPTPQDAISATYAPMLKKQDGLLDFSKSALQLTRQVRAFEPWPGSFFFWENTRIVVHAAHLDEAADQEVGMVMRQTRHPAVVTSSGLFVLDEVQPAGRKTMSGEAFANGSPGIVGSNLLQENNP